MRTHVRRHSKLASAPSTSYKHSANRASTAPIVKTGIWAATSCSAVVLHAGTAAHQADVDLRRLLALLFVVLGAVYVSLTPCRVCELASVPSSRYGRESGTPPLGARHIAVCVDKGRALPGGKGAPIKYQTDTRPLRTRVSTLLCTPCVAWNNTTWRAACAPARSTNVMHPSCSPSRWKRSR